MVGCLGIYQPTLMPGLDKIVQYVREILTPPKRMTHRANDESNRAVPLECEWRRSESVVKPCLEAVELNNARPRVAGSSPWMQLALLKRTQDKNDPRTARTRN